MIRDLIYPDDARKVIDSLHSGLRYDAAVAVLGNTCSETPLKGNGPDFSTGIRYGGIEEDQAVRRDVTAGFFTAMSLVPATQIFMRMESTSGRGFPKKYYRVYDLRSAGIVHSS
jgi:hypothetical protein